MQINIVLKLWLKLGTICWLSHLKKSDNPFVMKPYCFFTLEENPKQGNCEEELTIKLKPVFLQPFKSGKITKLLKPFISHLSHRDFLEDWKLNSPKISLAWHAKESAED